MRDDYVDEYGRPVDEYGRPRYASEVHGVREAPPAYPPQYYAPPSPRAPERPFELEAEIEEIREERGSEAGRWVATILACAVIGVVVGAAIVGILKFVNGPVSAKAKADPLEAARDSIKPTPATNVLQGKQVYLKYPSSFDQVGESRGNGGAAGFDSFMLSAKANSQSTIAVSVVTLDGSALDNDSSYKYRAAHPELYTSRTLSLGGERAVIMTKSDKTEATLFWPHAGLDLNLSVTSTDPHISASVALDQIVPTVRWVH